VLVLKVSATMVSGWSVFGLTGKAAAAVGELAPTAAVRSLAASAAGAAVDQARTAAQGQPRQIRLAPAATLAAHDAGPLPAGRHAARLIGGAANEIPADSSQLQSRARGVGSRFRAAPNRR